MSDKNICDEIGPWEYAYKQSCLEIERLKGLLETMVKGFAAEILDNSTPENIELYWQNYKTRQGLNQKEGK